jgi:hypothetical protein
MLIFDMNTVVATSKIFITELKKLVQQNKKELQHKH